MKKALLIIAGLAAAGFAANAQNDAQKAAADAAAAIAEAPVEQVAAPKPQYWTNSVEFDLGFNQTGLTNWAAGGYNTMTLSTGIDAQANYSKGLMIWNNRLQMQYAFLWSADKSDLLQKSNDRLYLESKWGYKTGENNKWSFSASFDFRSQFTNGYVYNTPAAGQGWLEAATLKAGFISPAYTNLALGIDWVPTNWFNVNVAPVTGGFTICTIEDLRKSYGMKLIEDTMDPAVGANYRTALFQFGAQVKINAKASINDKFTYDTQLVLFTDYLNHPFVYNRVNWDNKISWMAAKYFKVALNTWLVYDPIVEIDGITSKTQFKEFFSISFTYKISNKK